LRSPRRPRREPRRSSRRRLPSDPGTGARTAAPCSKSATRPALEPCASLPQPPRDGKRRYAEERATSLHRAGLPRPPCPPPEA